MNLLIKHGTIVNPGSGFSGIGDILIRDGKIDRLDHSIEKPDDCAVYDATGLHILPGLVDAHCHLREPGFEYKEDIESGSISAAFGGFTAVACMPNTDPVIDNKIVLSYVIHRAKEVGLVKVLPIAAATIGQKGEILTDMGTLAKWGAVAYSDDGRPIKSAAMMKKAMEMASMDGLLIISHCEDPDLASGGTMNEGVTSMQMGVKGIPSAAEDVMVARELLLAEYTGIPVHIAHVSTRTSVELIRQAKKRKVPVTAETCPHYFSITETVCSEYNALGKVNPPLRTDDDVKAIIEGLVDGTLDIIATDHAPHHEDEKMTEFQKAANGLVGFETAFSLAITNLVIPSHLTLENVVEKMSLNPARLFRMQGGRVQEGYPADLTVVNMAGQWTVDRFALHSKSKNSPYHGMVLSGTVESTVVDGRFIMKDRALQ